MPALLPADTVGCIGTCAGATTITAVAPAAFATAAATHGKHVKIAGATASWSDAGLGPSCNEVAFMQQTNLSFSIKLSGDAKFIDFGWCSPSLNPGGDWASSAEAGWMGEQGVDKAWIYRSSGWFNVILSFFGLVQSLDRCLCDQREEILPGDCHDNGSRAGACCEL